MFAGKFTPINDAQLPAALNQCVTDLASDIIHIDLRHITQAPVAIALLGQRAQFPAYFGQNLDALYDVVCERLSGIATVNQTWLIRSTHAQEKLFFPMLDTLRDAMDEASNDALTILWWVNA